LPSIAQLWLTPRLKALRARLPDVKPSLHALEAPPNFQREPFDLAIFFVPRREIGPHVISLGADLIFPVCAPDLARRLRAPADLASVTLLHDTTWTHDWPLWAAGARQVDPRGRDAMAFSLYSVAVQAAIDGAGVLMGHDALVAGALESGALVAPFRRKIATGRDLAAILPTRPCAQAADIVAQLKAT
jgi:LysR family glycine cleavage system transcriptional activator